MHNSVRAACRRFLPPGILRARRVLSRLPHVIWRSASRLRHQAMRRQTGAPGTVLLHPFRPHIEDDYSLTLIACRLGLRLTTDHRHECAAAMYWHDTTRRPLSPLLEELAASLPVINLRGNDISKTRVDAAMRDAFGYGLAVDPLTTPGPLVEKADTNAMHDGRIAVGPLATMTPGRVYQRLIRGRIVGGLVEEIRVPIVGERVPFVHLKYKKADDPLALSIRGGVAEPTSVLEGHEIASLLHFARIMGIDFGELDVMRDHADGRVYVFDANNTPCVRFVGVSAADRRATVECLAAAFDEAFLRRRARRAGVGGDASAAGPLSHAAPPGHR
jgi:hypothetical protein